MLTRYGKSLLIVQSYMDKVQKELAYWQKKVVDTMGRVMDDDHITGLQKIINLYMLEADSVNDTLNRQKAEH